MLLNPTMARLVAGSLSYLSSRDEEIYIEENPGLWVEVRTTDDPEIQIRIDAETYEVSYRAGMGSWVKLPFELKKG